MLSRLFRRSLPLHLRTLTLDSSSSSFHSLSPSFPPPNPTHPIFLRPFSSSSSHGGGGDDGKWSFPPETDEIASLFGGVEEPTISGIADNVEGEEIITESKKVVGDGDLWAEEEEPKGDIFEGIETAIGAPKAGAAEREGDDNEWETAEGYEPWSLGEDGRGEKGVGFHAEDDVEELTEEQREMERKEEQLMATIKGPNRAFGDLIAASGITEDMIDSLILLKDVRGIEGLPPLQEIEDKAIARMNAKSSRTEIERKKQEEIANARVRQVDEKGRAYGTGRRKCSIARVWIQPGDGKFTINEKQFDAYFPMLDSRAELLRPFTVTNTLGLWDVTCTVKGGGTTGQAGAVRLGISRALENWEPGLRKYLKPVGFLTRDSRIVERKKPGKAKARKSFQWVKR